MKDRIPELEELMVEMTEEAISVKLDYQVSGSIVAIHHNSTLLDNETEQLSDVAINIKRKENDK